jgi:molybdopterin biosynthesis enzyme MoaB
MGEFDLVPAVLRAAVVRGNTSIVNFPGSVKGASLCARVILPILGHSPSMLRGEAH